jgi:pimeloyl-ACP methyl ester carboxylesterase
MTNPIELDYATYGAKKGLPLLLIMGLATQRIAWPMAWIDTLVARGFYVISFDNRDIGLSTRLDYLGAPKIARVMARRLIGIGAAPPYTLLDMADDTCSLLDQLGVQSAHVLGVSMGGMIAQRLALANPERVLSLTLMMTSSGYPLLPLPNRSVLKIFAGKPPADMPAREAAVDYLLRLFGEIGSPGYPVPLALRRERALEQVNRSIAGLGAMRQLAAILADGARWRLLSKLKLPVQILHGAADKMVPIAHGRDLARRIPGARFEIVPGLGHDVPEGLAALIADRMAHIAGLQ